MVQAPRPPVGLGGAGDPAGRVQAGAGRARPGQQDLRRVQPQLAWRPAGLPPCLGQLTDDDEDVAALGGAGRHAEGRRAPAGPPRPGSLVRGLASQSDRGTPRAAALSAADRRPAGAGGPPARYPARGGLRGTAAAGDRGTGGRRAGAGGGSHPDGEPALQAGQHLGEGRVSGRYQSRARRHVGAAGAAASASAASAEPTESPAARRRGPQRAAAGPAQRSAERAGPVGVPARARPARRGRGSGPGWPRRAPAARPGLARPGPAGGQRGIGSGRGRAGRRGVGCATPRAPASSSDLHGDLVPLSCEEAAEPAAADLVGGDDPRGRSRTPRRTCASSGSMAGPSSNTRVGTVHHPHGLDLAVRAGDLRVRQDGVRRAPARSSRVSGGRSWGEQASTGVTPCCSAAATSRPTSLTMASARIAVDGQERAGLARPQRLQQRLLELRVERDDGAACRRSRAGRRWPGPAPRGPRRPARRGRWTPSPAATAPRRCVPGRGSARRRRAATAAPSAPGRG